jgi:hypothetical protein
MGLSQKIRQKINEKKEEAKEKVNPFSQTNKSNRAERHREQTELKKAEQESYRKEKRRQIEERGKRTAQHEYGPRPSYSGGSKHRSSSGRRNSGMPAFVPVSDPLFGMGRKSRPKAAPSKTTTVRTGNKTITIREKQEDEQKKKGPRYEFYDPFDLN